MAVKGNMGGQQEQEHLTTFDPAELVRLYGEIAQRTAPRSSTPRSSNGSNAKFPAPWRTSWA